VVRTADGSAFAIIKKIPARSEFEIHILEPLRMKSEPSFLAVVFKLKASEPEEGSVNAKLLT
jgi:hypothetical protein